MKNRSHLNLLIDVLLTIDLALLAGIGWLLKYTLPPGRDRILKTGDNRELLFLGWDRHQWGDIHLVVALMMIGLLVLHIVFHWGQIVSMVRNAVPRKALRGVLTAVLTMLALVFFLAAFVVKPEKGETEAFLHRNARIIEEETAAERTPAPAVESETATESAADASIPEGNDPPGSLAEKPRVGSGEATAEKLPEEDHLPGLGGDAIVNGRMTLAESATLYKISTAEVKRRLGLPSDVPDGETLGRLRRTYGLSMVRIRELLEERRSSVGLKETA